MVHGPNPDRGVGEVGTERQGTGQTLTHDHLGGFPHDAEPRHCLGSNRRRVFADGRCSSCPAQRREGLCQIPPRRRCASGVGGCRSKCGAPPQSHRRHPRQSRRHHLRPSKADSPCRHVHAEGIGLRLLDAHAGGRSQGPAALGWRDPDHPGDLGQGQRGGDQEEAQGCEARYGGEDCHQAEVAGAAGGGPEGGGEEWRADGSCWVVGIKVDTSIEALRQRVFRRSTKLHVQCLRALRGVGGGVQHGFPVISLGAPLFCFYIQNTCWNVNSMDVCKVSWSVSISS